MFTTVCYFAKNNIYNVLHAIQFACITFPKSLGIKRFSQMLNNDRQPTKLNHFSDEKVQRRRACKTDLCNSKDANIFRRNLSRV